MKIVFSVLGFILILACKSSVNPGEKPNYISSDQLREMVSFFSSDALLGRDTGSEGLEEAAKYIEAIFKDNNIKPYFETYRDSFNIQDKIGYNIVGFIEGNDPQLKSEVVIIGAHYDHIGYAKKVAGDSIANGANDNASGTSVVLSLATYFSSLKNTKRSIMFTLFSAEEKGSIGSKHLAKKLKEQGINLYTMLNFEMLGVPFVDRDYDAFITGFGMSNMASKINVYAGLNLVGFSEVSVQYNLFRRSDNYAFYEAFNLPCQSVSSCDLSNYDYYHHVDDEAEKLDYEFMANFISKIIPALQQITNTPTKEIQLTNG